MADLSTFLFDVKTELERRGHVVNQETIKEVVLRASHPLVRHMIESDQWTVEQVVSEIEAGIQHLQARRQNAPAAGVLEGGELPPGTTISDFAEGGLINDRSGQASERIRRQFGIR